MIGVPPANGDAAMIAVPQRREAERGPADRQRARRAVEAPQRAGERDEPDEHRQVDVRDQRGAEEIGDREQARDAGRARRARAARRACPTPRARRRRARASRARAAPAHRAAARACSGRTRGPREVARGDSERARRRGVRDGRRRHCGRYRIGLKRALRRRCECADLRVSGEIGETLRARARVVTIPRAGPRDAHATPAARWRAVAARACRPAARRPTDCRAGTCNRRRGSR